MFSSNQRIAKNTIFLYIRMFVTMVTSLFTSRIVLNILGETDYGIYNIVGGVVVLFSFLDSALLSATQRYLNFSLGEGNLSYAHKVFCMSMNSYIILSLIAFLFGETIGLWFINSQLNIPDIRKYAANWVYQFTLITLCVNLIRVPYNASIIAHEKMNVYAYISFLEVFFKLIVVYLLYITTFDKLIIYSFLYFLVPLITTWIYKLYCNKYFAITHFKILWDKKLFKQLFSFSGWSLFGSIANLSASQGLNILVNIFHGVTVNAALGIANQVSSAVTRFVSNFQVAFNPQIVKNYASKQYEQLYNLIFRSSKISYFLLLIIALPLLINIDLILSIWLTKVPEYSGIFSQLILVFSLMEALTAPLWMFVQATGKIKTYQILVASLIFLNFPLIYIVLKIGLPVYYAWIIRICVNILVIAARCIYIKIEYGFPIKKYCNRVLLPVGIVTAIVVPLSFIFYALIPGYWLRFYLSAIFSICVTIVCVTLIGLTKEERTSLYNLLKNIITIRKKSSTSNYEI